jgi:O-antigen ligase
MVLYILTISVVEDERSIDRLFTIYVLSFAFYGIWGITSGGRVPFHVNMNNEDAFGPFMAMGVPMAFFFAHRMGSISYRSISVFVICVIGVVASFARGAFLSLCSGIVYIWYLYHRKIAAFFSVVIIFMVILASSSIIFKESSYWDEMSTIIDAHKADVGDLGRQYLWTSAVKMFLAHPIEGVGPRNYGIVLPRFTTPEQIEPRGIRYSEIYGRVPHNIYMQILAEMGIIGSVAFLLLVTIFFKRNRITRRAYEVLNKRSRFGHFEQKPDGTDDIRKYYYLAIATQGAFIIYLVNGLFYDLLYFHWFSDLLILNSLVYQASRKRALNMADVHRTVCN